MASIYSLSFWDGNVATGGAATDLFTVPDGFVYVVRDIDGWSESAAGADVYLGVTGNRAILLKVASNVVGCQWRGRQVYSAGNIFQAFPTQANFHLKISGYKLSA